MANNKTTTIDTEQLYKITGKAQTSLMSQLKLAYHFGMAQLGAVLYAFPSKRITVIGVTGTKGKSSTVEMVNAIMEETGRTTAVLGSIRVKIGDESKPNTLRMSMPGRFYIQQFLDKAIHRDCSVAIIEMTSEGARQYRHRGIEMDALIFTNLSPEHIESHGSLEEYANAKFEIGKQLARSSKRPRIIVANADDAQSPRYLTLPIEEKLPFTLSACAPYEAGDHGGFFTFDNTKITVHIPGEFSLKNAVAAATLARAMGVSTPIIARAFERLRVIPGRGELIEAGQDFPVVVDYAHTPDSLTAIYDAFATSRKICIIGSMGGGRDTWKRPVMGGIADKYCHQVIVTNEDPCDEDPQKIMNELASGMKRTPMMISDRREAIRNAIALAKKGDAVLITGKGTDTSIKGPKGSSIPWSDAQVAREELEKVVGKTS